MTKKIVRMTGAYFGVILGTTIGQLVLQGRIEHVLIRLILVATGYLVALAVYILIVFICRKKL